MNISNALRLVLQKPSELFATKKVLTIIFDAAHGEDVPGKRSPDGKFREYAWSRMMIDKIMPRVAERGYAVRETNTTDKEIGLSRRKNIADAFEGQNKVLLSIHNNAAGNGSTWMNASGIEFFTTKGQTGSDVFAECLYKAFSEKFPNIKMRVDKTDGDSDKESNFTVLMGSSYFAVLAEILFQDSKEDIAKLTDDAWCERCADAFIEGIEFFNYIIQNS